MLLMALWLFWISPASFALLILWPSNMFIVSPLREPVSLECGCVQSESASCRTLPIRNHCSRNVRWRYITLQPYTLMGNCFQLNIFQIKLTMLQKVLSEQHAMSLISSFLVCCSDQQLSLRTLQLRNVLAFSFVADSTYGLQKYIGR